MQPMTFNSLRTQRKLGRNLSGRESLAEQLEYLELAVSQSSDQAVLAVRAMAVEVIQDPVGYCRMT